MKCLIKKINKFKEESTVGIIIIVTENPARALSRVDKFGLHDFSKFFRMTVLQKNVINPLITMNAIKTIMSGIFK